MLFWNTFYINVWFNNLYFKEFKYKSNICSTFLKIQTFKSNHPPSLVSDLADQYIVYDDCQEPPAWTCLLCTQVFNLKCNARRHYVNQHTEIKQTACSICQTVFKNRENLVQHLKRKHNIEKSERWKYMKFWLFLMILKIEKKL